ncbi:MAG TPA: NosD domain-containing protein [Candidatus Bathyarchaeia archaeon]
MSRQKHIATPILIFALMLSCLSTRNVLFVRIASAGTTWIVDDDGSTIGSIQTAINSANDGDTILVLSGTYYEHLFVEKRLSIIGENENTTIIDGGGLGIIVHVAGNNITLKGFTIQHGETGVFIENGKEENTLSENKVLLNMFSGIYGDQCGKTVIANNNVSFNGWHGIFLYGCAPSILDSNFIFSNGDDGIRIRYSSNNTITGNFVVANENGILVYSDEDPIRLGELSKNNVIRENHVLNNSCGISIRHYGVDVSPARNEISENNIDYNGVGLNITGSNDNLVYHNNFINNSEQFSLEQSYNDIWDGGYYVGGNYWSDHVYNDTYWGVSQNITGSDGVIDVSYQVSTNSTSEDRFPFSQADGWMVVPEVNVTSPLNGTYRVNTLTLALSLNKPALVSYSLDDQANSTLAENLTLSDLLVGAHSVRVYTVDTLYQEASSEAQFTITFVGDLNLDMIVDIVDISMVASHFGETLGSQEWNSDMDLNGDNEIEIVDITIVAQQFGNTL